MARHDTKFAMHALRLDVPGVELLTTGRITLPLPEPDRDRLRAIRRSEVDLAEAISAVEFAEGRLEDLRGSSGLPNVGRS